MSLRTGVALVLASLALAAAPTEGRAAEPAPDASAAAKPSKNDHNKKKSSKKKKVTPANPAADAEKPGAKRRRLGVSPAFIVGDTSAHFIDESAPKINPFPSDGKAVTKAWAENRRDQIVDAEKAARAEKSPDRWRSVLFMLHGLPEHNDSEVCFWRVLSFYRLVEIERARKLREGCELPAKDSSVLNQEDARASGTPSMEDLQQAALAQGASTQGGSTPQGASTKDASAEGPSPTTPYAGPSPQRRD